MMLLIMTYYFTFCLIGLQLNTIVDSLPLTPLAQWGLSHALDSRIRAIFLRTPRLARVWYYASSPWWWLHELLIYELQDGVRGRHRPRFDHEVGFHLDVIL